MAGYPAVAIGLEAKECRGQSIWQLCLRFAGSGIKLDGIRVSMGAGTASRGTFYSASTIRSKTDSN